MNERLAFYTECHHHLSEAKSGSILEHHLSQHPRICEDTEPRTPLLNTVVSWTSGLGRPSSSDIPTPKHKRNVTVSVHLWSAATKLLYHKLNQKVSCRFSKSVSMHLRMARHNENSDRLIAFKTEWVLCWDLYPSTPATLLGRAKRTQPKNILIVDCLHQVAYKEKAESIWHDPRSDLCILGETLDVPGIQIIQWNHICLLLMMWSLGRSLGRCISWSAPHQLQR